MAGKCHPLAVWHARVGRAFEEAERIGELDVQAVREVLARSHGRKGRRNVELLLAERRVPTDTREGIERDFADELRRAGLPMPAFNVLIEGYLVDAGLDQGAACRRDSTATHSTTGRRRASRRSECGTRSSSSPVGRSSG